MDVYLFLKPKINIKYTSKKKKKKIYWYFFLFEI